MAKVIAKTMEGNEYLYSKLASYKVAEKSAKAICKVLNDCKWQLKDGEIWHIYDVGEWELDFMNARFQRLTKKKNGMVVARSYDYI